MIQRGLVSQRTSRFAHPAVVIGLLAILVLVLGACATVAPGATEAEAPAAAEEEATSPAEEEAAAEEETAAEEEAAPPAEEEAAAEEEATPPAEEEAATEEEATAEEEATPPAEEEAATEEEAAAEEEATPPAEEEAEGDGAMMAGDPEAGAYIVSAAIGCGCHFTRDIGTLAGGSTFMDGAVTAKNLTPHETGILNESDEELADAIRFASHDGQALVVMPAYSGMSDEDVMNVIAYLRSLEPVEHEIPERTIDFEPTLGEFEAPPATAPTEGVERGQYLGTLARCGRCHTPQNEDGSLDWSRPLAGSPFRDTVAPNLTPDDETGLGQWTEEGIAEFLATGLYQDGTEAHGGMMSQVNGGLNKLTDDDRLAIAAFLKSLPAIANDVQPSE